MSIDTIHRYRAHSSLCWKCHEGCRDQPLIQNNLTSCSPVWNDYVRPKERPIFVYNYPTKVPVVSVLGVAEYSREYLEHPEFHVEQELWFQRNLILGRGFEGRATVSGVGLEPGLLFSIEKALKPALIRNRKSVDLFCTWNGFPSNWANWNGPQQAFTLGRSVA